MTPHRLASHIGTSAQSSHMVNDRSMESTCPRILLIRESSFCFVNFEPVCFSRIYEGGMIYPNDSEISSRRRAIVTSGPVSVMFVHIHSFGCTPGCHPIADKRLSIYARGTPYADEQTRLADNRNVVVLVSIHGSSLHDTDKGPRRRR
jgi:hypothetical protein